MQTMSIEAQELLSVATGYMRLGADAQAAAVLRQLLADEPNNKAASILLSFALEMQHQYRAALEVLMGVVEQSPELLDRVVRLAERTGNEKLALQARRERVAMTPGSPELCGDLAVALSRAEQHADAVRFFEKADLLEPGFLQRNFVEQHYYQQSRAALTDTSGAIYGQSN